MTKFIEMTIEGLFDYVIELTAKLTKADKRGDIYKRLAEKRGSKIVQLKADLAEADEMHTRAMDSIKLLESAYETSQERVDVLSSEVDRLKEQVQVGLRLETEKSVKIAELRALVQGCQRCGKTVLNSGDTICPTCIEETIEVD